MKNIKINTSQKEKSLPATSNSSEDIGKRIMLLRVDMGMTQDQLANSIPIERARLSDIERGKTQPRLGTLNKIAEALKCTTHYLMTGEIDMHELHTLVNANEEGRQRLILSLKAQVFNFGNKMSAEEKQRIHQNILKLESANWKDLYASYSTTKNQKPKQSPLMISNIKKKQVGIVKALDINDIEVVFYMDSAQRIAKDTIQYFEVIGNKLEPFAKEHSTVIIDPTPPKDSDLVLVEMKNGKKMFCRFSQHENEIELVNFNNANDRLNTTRDQIKSVIHVFELFPAHNKTDK